MTNTRKRYDYFKNIYIYVMIIEHWSFRDKDELVITESGQTQIGHNRIETNPTRS